MKNRWVPIIKILVWPITLIAILLIFKGVVGPKEIEISAKSIKISFFLLQAAERGGPSENPPTTPPDVKVIQEVAQSASSLSLDGAKVLWVDGNPQNNTYERDALSAIGIEFTLAKTTNEALPLMIGQQFRLVITNFKRSDDPRAGYTLLEDIKRLSHPPPLIIYSASASPEYEAEAKKKGALGETNEPQRLFSMAIEAVAKKL